MLPLKYPLNNKYNYTSQTFSQPLLTTQTNLFSAGLQMGGEQFIFMSGTDQVLKGVKKESGVHVAKTVQAIVIGCYDDPTTPDECAKEVDTMADCLKGMNY